MNYIFLRRYQGMILFGILCFYLGCGISLTFVRVDCATNSVALVKNSHSTFNKTEYAVLVLSSPKNEMLRDAVRTTWASLINNVHVENGEILYRWNYTLAGKKFKQGVVKIYFAIGTQNLDKQTLEKLYAEDSRTNDLLLLDNFEDGYNKLATKLMLSLKWFHKNLKELKYVIKCDDDSFVRVDLVVADLEAYAPEMDGQAINHFISRKESLPKYKGLYWGYFNGRAPVYKRGKWEEKAWFLCNTYLPYALGGGYVISRSIVDYVVRNSDFLSKYNSEDVSMGVWTAALDGINRVHDTRFDTEWISRGCDNTMLVRHKQEHSDMVQMYSNLVISRGKKLCTTDYIIRKSYNYNWNALPNSCCIKTNEDLR
ncbi:beta-1,3-galactosyltransferase 6-like [Maniola hyperantus]|uniref:beta-1,3-galactosyltransferase 6-like n=1 Tax=Aphantopus hyperantus TaxID=2795564 RepID=UPI0015681FAC|nr:beta-1,3-galactosyltransferase 6 [Maniola hyperantus]